MLRLALCLWTVLLLAGCAADPRPPGKGETSEETLIRSLPEQVAGLTRDLQLTWLIASESPNFPPGPRAFYRRRDPAAAPSPLPAFHDVRTGGPSGTVSVYVLNSPPYLTEEERIGREFDGILRELADPRRLTVWEPAVVGERAMLAQGGMHCAQLAVRNEGGPAILEICLATVAGYRLRVDLVQRGETPAMPRWAFASGLLPWLRRTGAGG